MTYDLIIIGGGPAGAAAGVYAARKRLQTLVIAERFSGQSVDSDCIYNWIGTKEISGQDLAKSLEDHVRSYTTDGNTLSIAEDRVETIQKKEQTSSDTLFTIVTKKESFTTRSVLIASGSRRRKLPIKGADTFEHKGVMYCATCDGPLFSGQPVAVVGGGNAALEAVLQLAQYASHVTLLHRSDSFRADEITVEKVRALSNATIMTNVSLEEVHGDVFVSGISFTTNNSESTTLPIAAVFVEIGQLPNTDIAKDVASLDPYGKIIVDPRNQRATTAGIWAAGDCTDCLYHQNNIAAGDAVKALEDIYIWLQ